eukprot:gene49428-60506_t
MLALLAGLGGTAGAAELVNNDDLQIRWDNSVKYTVGARVKSPTAYYLDNPNTNDADAAFKSGDLITNRLDWLTEFDLSLKDKANSGLRISAAGWYDNVYRGSHDAIDPTTYNATSVSNTQYTAYARKWAGQGADLLDAFVHTGFDLGSHNLAQAPVDVDAPTQLEHFLTWAAQHARNGSAGEPWFLDQVDEHSRLDRMEQALRQCTLWLWLDLRFPGVYGQVDDVLDLRARLNEGIERQLKGKRPLWQQRGGRR